MSSLKTYAHAPTEVLDYTVDFASLLDDGESIATPYDANVTVTVPDGLTLEDTVVVGGTAVTAWISGGAEGMRYVVTYTADTDANRTFTQSITLNTGIRNLTTETDQLLVSVDELRSYMSSIGLTADQAIGAQDVLFAVQSELQSYLNRPLVAVTVVDEPVAVGRNGFLFTRHSPVTAVSSIKRYPTLEVSPASTYQVVNGLIRLRHAYVAPGTFYGWDALHGPPGTLAPEEYLVSYTASLPAFYPESLGALKGFILRVAAREVENNHDDTLTPKDLTTKDDGKFTPPGPTDEDFKRVERWRRPVVAT